MIAVVFCSLLFSHLARAASSGAKACDALGLCSESSSRAHFDTELNEDGCKLIFTSEETRNRDCGTGSSEILMFPCLVEIILKQIVQKHAWTRLLAITSHGELTVANVDYTTRAKEPAAVDTSDT